MSDAFPQLAFDPARDVIENGYVGRGYALPTTRGREAAALAAKLAKLTLDSTYTAKAMAALVGEAPALRGKEVLFWNTYDARRLDLRGLDASDLPEVFRGYFRQAQSRRSGGTTGGLGKQTI